MTVNGYEDNDDVEGDDVEGDDDVEGIEGDDVEGDDVDEEDSLLAIWRGVFACAIGPYNRL